MGAGLSSAFGLPNTPSLINAVVAFARTKPGEWLRNDEVESKLREAFRFFYPDAGHDGFQPDVVDFFSTLRTYLDVGAGLVGTGFEHAPELYRLLRRGIAHVLIQQAVKIDSATFAANPYLAEMVKPGNIIITSNWDLLIERFAELNGVRLRLSSSARHFPTDEVALLKLHGSLDWCTRSTRASGFGDDNYASLSELQQPSRNRRPPLPDGPEDVIRIRTNLKRTWAPVRSRAREPYLVTMVTGKADDLGPLIEVWRDAYRALSRARTVEIVGYSMPPDDVEIRTILRTGIQRGNKEPVITVRNPAPDVHYRVRQYLQRNARSNYQPVSA